MNFRQKHTFFSISVDLIEIETWDNQCYRIISRCTKHATVTAFLCRLVPAIMNRVLGLK